MFQIDNNESVFSLNSGTSLSHMQTVLGHSYTSIVNESAMRHVAVAIEILTAAGKNLSQTL